MSDANTARSVLWPDNNKIVVRVCLLYVGQGSSIILMVRDSDDGKSYKILLVDSNLDKEHGGIDMPALVKDLSPDGHLYAFVNTHPHDDHLRGLKEVSEEVVIDNVWHSGHKPTKKYGNYHPDLTALIKDAEKRNGKEAVVQLKGSDSPKDLFDATYYVLAPAKYVNDDVNEEEAEARYRRIHENCAVIRVGVNPAWALITGDADLDAFKTHITEHHKERLSAVLLDASHHGSRSFFKQNQEDEPYLDALEAIDPTYVVISAPTEDESPHDHPHPDALELYEDHVGKENVFHTGKERETYLFDIYEDGTFSPLKSDGGKLAEDYALDGDDDGGDDGGGKATGPFVRPSAPGEYTPRKYG